MTTESTRPVRQAAANAVGSLWWYFLLRGLLILGVGIFVLLKPGLSAAVFAQVLGVLLLVDGLLAVAAGIAGHTESRLWSIARGILMALAGLFVFLQPTLVAKLTVTALLFIVAPFVIINGVLEIVAALQGRQDDSGKKASFFGGVLTAVFGLLLILAPIAFGVLIVRILGIVAILIGLILLFLAFKFRKLRNRIGG